MSIKNKNKEVKDASDLSGFLCLAASGRQARARATQSAVFFQGEGGQMPCTGNHMRFNFQFCPLHIEKCPTLDVW